MMFLALVAAVLVARLDGWSRRSPAAAWGADWRRTSERWFAGVKSAAARRYLVLLLPALLVLVAVLVLDALDWRLAAYVLAFGVLLLCFDDGGLEADLARYLKDLERTDLQAAYHDARELSGDAAESSAESWEQLHRQTLAAASYRSYQRYFPVIFWFVVLGLPGAVFYRTLGLFHSREDDAQNPRLARLQYLLDWLPSRLFGLALALVGNFNPVLGRLKESMSDGGDTAELLRRLLSAAIPPGDLPAGDTPSAEVRELEELPVLVERALVIWIAVLGLIAIL